MKLMAELQPGVEGSALAVGSAESVGRVEKVGPEDYDLDTSDHTAVKVICLGDSAVGKSK